MRAAEFGAEMGDEHGVGLSPETLARLQLGWSHRRRLWASAVAPVRRLAAADPPAHSPSQRACPPVRLPNAGRAVDTPRVFGRFGFDSPEPITARNGRGRRLPVRMTRWRLLDHRILSTIASSWSICVARRCKSTGKTTQEDGE